MVKVMKRIFITMITLVLAWVICWQIDTYRIKRENPPVFCIAGRCAKNGSRKYYGIFYHISRQPKNGDTFTEFKYTFKFGYPQDAYSFTD